MTNITRYSKLLSFVQRLKHKMDLRIVIVIFSSCIQGYFSQCFYTESCMTRYDKGRYYRGNISMTEHGKLCLDWDGHGYDVTNQRYPTEGLEKNFCRNPLGSGVKPWCYTDILNTTKINGTNYWGFCEIPDCEPCYLRGIQFKDGDAFHNGCSQCVCLSDGIRCYGCPNSPSKQEVEFGCYKVSAPTAKYPACCERKICHSDKEFNFKDYTNYLRKVLQN